MMLTEMSDSKTIVSVESMVNYVTKGALKIFFKD